MGMGVGGAVGVGVRVAVLVGVDMAVRAVVGMLVICPARVGMVRVVIVMVVGNAVLMHIFVVVIHI